MRQIRRENELATRHGTRLAIEIEDEGTGILMGSLSGVFVDERFGNELLHNPAPYPFLRATQWHDMHRDPILDWGRIRQNNTRGGLTLLMYEFGLHKSIKDPHDLMTLKSRVSNGFADRHRGYRLNRIIAEVYLEENLQDLLAIGMVERARMQLIGNSESNYAYLTKIDRSEAQTCRDPFITKLFEFSEPHCSFGRSQLEMLELACLMMSDEEIAEKLMISLSAVKKRWVAAYAHVEQVLPGLLPENTGNGRGPEKRNLLIRYLNQHPEDLRPRLGG